MLTILVTRVQQVEIFIIGSGTDGVSEFFLKADQVLIGYGYWHRIFINIVLTGIEMIDRFLFCYFPTPYSSHDTLGKVSKNKLGKSMVFYQPRGGSPGVVKKPYCFFEKGIFQRVSRIILGPPKHVLHLVWSAYFISTAVRTALKVARTPQILGERRQL